MVSQILDATIVLKDRNVPVINTEFNILVYWDIVIHNNNDSAHIEFVCNKIEGVFSWRETIDDIKKRVQIEFSSTDKWKFEAVQSNNSFYSTKDKAFPEKATINFDLKTAKIYF